MTAEGEARQALHVLAPVARANPWWPVRTSTEFVVLAVLLATVLGAISLALALSTTHLEHPGANALVRPYLVVSPILVGLLWKLRRPDSLFGLMLVVLGLTFFPIAWQPSNDALVHTLGVVLGDTLALAATFYLALVFPVGRLTGRADTATMLVLTASMVALALAALGRPVTQGGGALSRCGEACPPNPVQIELPSQLMNVISFVESAGLLVATAATIVIIGVRIARASRPRRRAFVGVALTSLFFFPVFLAYQVARRTLGADAEILEPLGWLNIAARLAFALGFLWVLMQAELSAGAVLRSLLARLKDRPTPLEWERAVAESLDDSGLRIGFWDPARRAYRDLDGGDLDEPVGPDRAWVTVQRDQDPVAAFTVDGALRSDPELLRSVSDATLLAVEYGALEGELRTSRLAEIEAEDSARRRIAQDLHDSAQQRLIALRVHLELMRERTKAPDVRAAIDQLGVQVTDALGDIRAVSRGTHTERLQRLGLGPALETVVASMRAPVTLDTEGLGRYPDDVEQAVYFSVLEALQNVAKHAGPTAHATVVLAERDGALDFTVTDDGRGFDPAVVAGHGVDGMRARISATGGRLTVQSAPGSGTTVRAIVPLAVASSPDAAHDSTASR